MRPFLSTVIIAQVRSIREGKLKATSPLFTIGKVLWPLALNSRHDVTDLKIVADGQERFDELGGKRTIICPNHPTAADGDVMFLFSNRVNESFAFVAAHEIFRAHKGLYGAILKLYGCYPVRRGSPDRRSLRSIIKGLVTTYKKLVIFPEGEISHQHDSVMPLEPGAAQIAFWTLDELKRKEKDESVFILPVALAYAYLEDPRYHFDFAFGKLEERLGVEPRNDLDHQSRLKLVSIKLLEILEVTYSIEPDDLSIDERLSRLRMTILTRLSVMIDVHVEGDEVDLAHRIYDRLDRLRFSPHEQSEYAEMVHEEQRQLAYLLIHDLHRAMNLRFLINKCSGLYGFQEIAEALYLLERELLKERLPSAKKTALLAVGYPIDAKAFLKMYEMDRRQAIERINREIVAQIKNMQNELRDEVARLEIETIHPQQWTSYHKSLHV